MQKEKKDKHFIHQPVYPGGREAMKVFIKKNLKYPKKALEARVEGTVTLKYTIDQNGKVIDTNVISGLGHGCDEEAERLVRLFKFQMPKKNKRRVLFHKDIHIHFRLPKKRGTQITYVTPDKKEQEPSAPKGGSYHYTVTIRKK